MISLDVSSVSNLINEISKLKQTGCSRGTQILPSDCIINNFDSNVRSGLER